MKLIKCKDNEMTLNQLVESMYAGNAPILVWIDKDNNIKLIVRRYQRPFEICCIDLKSTKLVSTEETDLRKFLTEILDKNETVECFYSVHDFGQWLTKFNM